MKKRVWLALGMGWLLLTGGLALATAEEAQPPPGPREWTLDITLGGVISDITNQHSSRFEYGRDVPEGFYVEEFLFTAESPGKPWAFTLFGVDAGQRDQHFRLTLERFGRYRLELRGDQFPLFVADNIQTLHTATDKGVLEVPDLIQTEFQAAADADLPALVRSTLAATPFSELELLRRKFVLHQVYRPSAHWQLYADISNEIRSGDRRMTVGSYLRTVTPRGETFYTPGIEAPEPIDYRTTEIIAGGAYEGARGFLRAEYRGSFFRNRTDTLTLDNPFRITDELASRLRFERTQVDLYPDNDTHTFSFLGGYSFEPWTTRVAGALSFSFWNQNDPFLAYTLNTSIVAPPGDLPPGTTPTDLEALPQASLNGDATVVAGDVAVTTRPASSLRLAVRYNAYDWNDETDEIEFPGYAGVGDSRWEESHGGRPIATRPFDFFRQRSGVEVAWKPRKELAWKTEFGWEAWNRENREITRSNEWLGKTQLILTPRKWFYGKLNYGYGARVPHDVYVARKEFVLLRKYDLAHRIRQRAEALFQLTPNPQFNFSGSYGYHSDRYDETLYGQATALLGFFTVDANYTPNERFAGYVNFTHERSRSSANLISKTGAVLYNIPNTFLRDLNDRVRSLGAGFEVNFLEQRLNWEVSYAFALSRLAIDTANPYTVDVQATLNATAYPFSDITEDFHEVRTTLRYKLRDNVEVGARYLFEPRSLNDFTTDLMTPYIDGFEAPENDLLRYIFLDARESSYHGHAAAIFLRYSF